ncbi:MAG: OmpH family outer membrane protein [Bacteroidota bacterium]
MNAKHIFLAMLMLMMAVGTATAQKIGYANIELVLAYMPESKSMNQSLATYEKKLGEKLQAKRQYLQTKYEDYQTFAQQTPTPSEAELKAKQDEVVKLEGEVQKEAAEAQQKLMERRQDLLEPIVEKMQNAIKGLASDEGYDYIFNAVDAGGVSIVLNGPEERDLTEKLMKKLGIEIPKADSGK